MSRNLSEAFISDFLSEESVSKHSVSAMPALMVLLTICLQTLRNVENYSMASPISEVEHRVNDRSVADALAKKVRVLCWVMTSPVNHLSKARHIKNTWGKRCNKLLFMSTEEDPLLPAIKLPVQEGYNFLWGKTKHAFQYVYNHHRDDADWFLKADDDTYVVVENLRYLLSEYNTSEPMYFGHRYQVRTPQGYMSGGAGYVLSKEALDLFVTQGLQSPSLCPTGDEGPEDVQIGICLYHIGVKAMDSLDSFHQDLFFPRSPQDAFTNYLPNCCSNHMISFHWVDAKIMYLYDFFVYRLRPYGVFSAAAVPEESEERSTTEPQTPVSEATAPETLENLTASGSPR